MRTTVVAAILLLGIACALPQPVPVAALPPVQTIKTSPISATAMPSAQPAPSGQAATAASNPVSVPTPAEAATAASKPGSAPTAAEAASVPPQSIDNVCSALITSAQANDLPVAFFANLIWQESRLRDNALSPKGAMGIAQFMPKVAAESGVKNPFDPSQALPAAAKLLHQLFDRLGNLGYAAAAYNAGTQRVLDWVEHARSLPRETRDYVMDITGRSIEAWRKKPEDDAGLRFAPQLPCRGLPAFAALEQAQAQYAELEGKQAEQARAQVASSQPKTAVQTAAASHPRKVAETAATVQRVKTARRERPRIRREAGARIRYALRERAQRRA
jgi:hypothetical protein